MDSLPWWAGIRPVDSVDGPIKLGPRSYFAPFSSTAQGVGSGGGKVSENTRLYAQRITYQLGLLCRLVRPAKRDSQLVAQAKKAAYGVAAHKWRALG